MSNAIAFFDLCLPMQTFA